MLIFIIFPFLSLSSAVSIKGNWKDSSLKDETLIFFEKVEPSLLNKVESSLKSVDKDDQSQILNSLSNFVYQPLFGLLNLSLSLRYFNPIASIKSPKEGNSTLHGWYLYEKKKNPINTRDYQNVHFTLIKGIDNHKTAREKLNYVNKASLSIESLITPNHNFKLYDRAKNTLKKYPQNYCYSGINGRIVKPQYFDILDGLIEEYRNSKLFSFSNALLYQNGYRQPYYFTKQLINCQDLPPFNVEKLIEKWSDEPKLKSTNYMEVLKCKKPIVTVNIYFDLRSPESPALLNWAIEHVLKSDPIYFNFTLYFDINNETEKHIGYAWHQSVDTLGVRNSILFMIDGFKKKNFKRAYKATLPTISWKKLKKNMVDDHKQTIRINEQLNYCREKNITVAASINGEFIQERPIFPIIENKVFAYINRIKSGVENGDHINFSQIIEWTQKNSIEMATSNCPIEITYNNYITINGFSNEIINSTANKIISLTKENSYKYPLIFFNSKKTSKYDVDISQFSEEEIQFLKANKNDIFTIFGPLVFKGIVLTENQLKFVQDYIDYVFITNNLEPKLSKEKVLLSLYYRSTNALDGIERKSIINNLSDSLKIELKSNSTLKWEIVDDPLSFNGPLILEMAAHVYDSGAASVIYYPNVKHSEYSSIPPHFNFHFRSSFNQDEVEIENKNYYLQTSPYWTVRKERNEEQFTCTSIITSSLLFASPGKKVKISDFYVTSTNDIGYLSPVLPIGKYEIEGMSSKSTVEKGNNYYYVDNFVPHCHFYFDNGERILSTSDSNELNIVLTPENESEQIKTEMKVLLYSILKNIKKTTKVKVFVASSFPFEMIKNVEIQVIPFYMPHFYEMKKASKKQLVDNWKFILSDIYLPNEKHYLFVDNKMLFVGDASRFLRLDMSSDSVVASPVMTERWFFDREELPWNSRKYLMMRFKRPYHTSSLIWIYMERWTDLHIGDRFRSILMSYIEANEKDQKIGEVIFNSIQLYAQFITLPEEIAFNSGRSSSSLAKNALSIDLTSFEGIRMAGIKYEKIKQQAFEEFE